MSRHILFVDDDALLRRSTAASLERAGYRVSTADCAEDALALVRRDPPDLILLDITLPGIDGFEALRRLRMQFGAPVIFVTGRRRELDELLGLELGADDYVTKPFDVDVLLAHIKAVLRRTNRREPNEPGQEPIVVGDLTIDPGTHTVSVGGRPVSLTPREFQVLHALALQPGLVIKTDDLVARVWGAEYEGESQVVYVHIRWLRDKLEEDHAHPRRIVTVHGVGYKLMPQ